MTDEQRTKIIDAAAARLSEFFGSVQIVASAVLPDGTTRGFRAGNGDFYARRALCQEFVELDQADTMARKINPPEEP
jgi:hypothetical protein